MNRAIPIPALIVLALSSTGQAAQAAAIERVAVYRGPGAIDGAVVAPGPARGSEFLYLAYMYARHTVDLVSVEPATGAWRVFENPAKSEFGAVMILGPDGNLYLGTRPHAHFYRFVPATGEYKDLGQPAPAEGYIWDLTFASDGKLYGCTYPSSKLVRYDPGSGKLEDLGRMDPTEQYGRWIAAGDDGFVYVGIGTARAHLVAYQLSTGEHRDILPVSPATQSVNANGTGNTALVHRGDDGKIYAEAGGRDFRVDGWTIKPIPKSEVHAAAPMTRLRDGSMLTVDGNDLVIDRPGSAEIRRHFTYSGRDNDVFRLAAGPGDHIYGSSVLPLHFFSVDPATKKLNDFGDLGHGEGYSIVSFGHRIYMAAYGGKDGAPLTIFDPAGRFAPASAPGSNPLLITYPGADTGWRPQAMILGPDTKFYIGSVAGYGSVNGPLTILNPANNQIVRIPGVVPNQSVVTLASAGNLVIGGTTIFGGGGSHPTEREAKLFAWDPRLNRKTYETTPVPGATNITDLLALPGGKVMGIATGTPLDAASPSLAASQETLFVFDLHSRKVDYTIPFVFKKIVYNGAALGKDGNVWGLVEAGVFRFAPRTRTVELAAKSPDPVTAGFALLNGYVYYACGPVIYRYGALGTPHPAARR